MNAMRFDFAGKQSNFVILLKQLIVGIGKQKVLIAPKLITMGDWVPRDGIDDDDDYENAEFSYKRGREGTIYLIDADKTIIQDADRFRQYLNCIEQDLLKSILVNAQDLVSVVVYNTDKSPDCNEMFRDEDAMPSDVIPSNCAVLIPLKRLDKQLIQYFKNFRESNDFFDFLNKYGTSDDCTLNDAMWLCSRMFIRCSRQLANSKIVLFTANDQPYLPGSGELQQTFVRAGDLRVNNTIIDLVPLVDEDDAFDMSAFYIEFLCAVNDLEPDEIRWHSPSDQRYLMENRLYRRNFRKNCLRHIKWELGDGLAIGCDVHSFTRSANKPTAIKIDRATNEVITAKRSHVAVTAPAGVNADNAADGGPANTATAPDSGIAASVTSAGNLTQGTHSGHMQRDEIAEANEIVETKVLPGELFKSQIVCGKEILFTSEELAQLKTILEPGVRLIGFKPLSTLKARWFVKHCCFLYPDDVKIKGSTKLFRGLWEKCIEKQKYALCVLTMQRKATPRYIALVPQTQEADNNDGFRIIHLPVETNYSYLDAANTAPPAVSDEMVAVFEKICKKLRFMFTPNNFGSPALKAFYSQIEALVFDENEAETGDDTLPDVDRQDGIVDAFIQEFNELFGSLQGGKRASDDAADGNRAKSSKKELSMADVENALQMDQDKAVTVQHLKDFIKSKRANPPANAVKKTLFEFAKRLID